MDAPSVAGARRYRELGTGRAPSWRGPRFGVAGTTGALVLGCVSLTPSLLPRDWGLQGAVTGLSAAFGYGVGTFLGWVLHEVTGWAPSRRQLRQLWVLVGVLGGPLLVLSLWSGQRWQRQIHVLTGERPTRPYEWLRILLVALAVLLVLVAAARAVRWVVRRLTWRLDRFLPERLAAPLAVLIVLVAVVGLDNAVVQRGLVDVANSTFESVNGTTTTGTRRPSDAARSGSPASLVPWWSLGRQGRDFVSGGPDAAQLAAFGGGAAPVQTPVRAYVGLRSAATPRARATLAVRELARAGGFQRAVLVVATTTGTGLVDPAAVDALEYMYRGDTATVAMQYSYLPSWISFLVDQRKAEVAGRLLFDRVYRAWAALPPGHRPTLLVTGTSLGAYGGEAAFSGVADLRRRTDGVVWAGPPHASPLHSRLVRHRRPGTPEWLPVYGAGRTVRFVSRPADLRRPPTRWPRPRVVYLQNGSDPILYWTPRLVFSKPDWLAEPRPPDVSPDMVWIPFVTFWQVTADLPFALDAPPGHGHDYRQVFADAWAAVAPPPGWTAHDTLRLRAVLSAGAGS